jgi:hypothetical protein
MGRSSANRTERLSWRPVEKQQRILPQRAGFLLSAAALRGAGNERDGFPRVASAAADFTRGYFRSIPPGRLHWFIPCGLVTMVGGSYKTFGDAIRLRAEDLQGFGGFGLAGLR